MALLKIEIDTEDLRIDEEGYGDSFEDLFHSELSSQITKRVIGNITKEEVGQYSILVQEKVSDGVDHLFNNLLSEDVVITDGYGSKKFVGCVEDYIKKEIDERYLHPVDGSGKKLVGCTSSSQTWVQWHLKNKCREHIDYAIENAKREVVRTIESTVKSQLKKYIDTTISETVTKNLQNVGIRV